MNEVMSELLDVLGFTAMAKDVLDEHDKDRLRRYAKVIESRMAEPRRSAVVKLFNHAREIGIL